MDQNQAPVEDKEPTQEKQYSEIELKAIDQGWIPKEEFDGDPSEFIDAPEFVRRGELFEKIERQSKELKALRQGHEALRKHHLKVKETEYERALKTLRAERKQAMINGDTEHALALEEKIDDLQADKKLLVEEARQAEIDEEDSYTPQFQSWVERNTWYETDDVMRGAADALGKKLHAQGNSPERVLELVEKEIRKEFPHKFQRQTPRFPAVEPSSRSGGGSKDTFRLTAEEEQMMQKIVAVTPGFTKEDYIKELKALKARLGE